MGSGGGGRVSGETTQLPTTTTMVVIWRVIGPFWVVCLLQARATEYCLLESFEPSCPNETFIFIKSAFYGRMRLGRCLTRDYYIGCSAEVTEQLDLLCSGRSHCYISLPEYSLIRAVPCPQDLVFYLDVEFVCIRGETGSSNACTKETVLQISNSKTGYLTSDFTLSTGIGSERCPWVIAALPGQRINLTLYNLKAAIRSNNNNNNNTSAFSSPRQASVSVGASIRCSGNVLATVRESPKNGAAMEKFVCDTASRESAVHLSSANSLTVALSPRNNAHSTTKYVIRYEVVGCADPKIPTGAHMTRDGDQAFFYCIDQQQTSSSSSNRHRTWKRFCRASDWIGPHNHCSDITKADHSSETDSMRNLEEDSADIFQLGGSQTSIGTVLIVGVSVGVILGICFLFTLSSVWYSYFSSFHVDSPPSPGDDGVATWKRGHPSYSLRMWTSGNEVCANQFHLHYLQGLEAALDATAVSESDNSNATGSCCTDHDAPAAAAVHPSASFGRDDDDADDEDLGGTAAAAAAAGYTRPAVDDHRAAAPVAAAVPDHELYRWTDAPSRNDGCWRTNSSFTCSKTFTKKMTTTTTTKTVGSLNSRIQT